MPRIALVTDSSACIPADLAARIEVAVLPIAIHLPERDLHDGLPEASSAVFSALDRGDPVKSSAPTAAEYLSAIEGADAEGVVVVTPAAEFTGMSHSASVAAELSERPAVVVDSRTAAAAQGLVVLAAAEAASGRAALEDVARIARDAARRAELVAVLESVENIRSSGRVPPFALELARRLGVRPVFRFRGGVVERVGVPRSEDAALSRIGLEWRSRGGQDAERAAVFHAAAPERAQALSQALGSRSPVVEFSPSMGIHTGPGVHGIAWLRRARRRARAGPRTARRPRRPEPGTPPGGR